VPFQAPAARKGIRSITHEAEMVNPE